MSCTLPLLYFFLIAFLGSVLGGLLKDWLFGAPKMRCTIEPKGLSAALRVDEYRRLRTIPEVPYSDRTDGER